MVQKRYPSTVPELCEDLRVAIEAGDEHNALIMAFAAELALFQESWPYCSRKCENEDADCPDGHPDRHGLEDTLGSIEALPWKYIRAKAQGVELPAPTPPPRLVGLGPDDPAPDFEDTPVASEPRTGPDLKLVNRLEEAESQAQRPESAPTKGGTKSSSRPKAAPGSLDIRHFHRRLLCRIAADAPLGSGLGRCPLNGIGLHDDHWWVAWNHRCTVGNSTSIILDTGLSIEFFVSKFSGLRCFWIFFGPGSKPPAAIRRYPWWRKEVAAVERRA